MVLFLGVIIATPAGTITLNMLGLIALAAVSIIASVSLERRRRMKIHVARAQSNEPSLRACALWRQRTYS